MTMTTPGWSGIKPAELKEDGATLDTEDERRASGFCSLKFQFRVPLDHSKKPYEIQEVSLDDPTTETLTLHARLVYAPYISPGDIRDENNWRGMHPRRGLMLYLCGGPGDGNKYDRLPEMNKFALEQGYHVLYVDYRGTGDSEPLTDDVNFARFLRKSAIEKAKYLEFFRQDNIVRDLEAIRLCLAKEILDGKCPEDRFKWTVLGQSFGGWIALTYLSFLPAALDAVYLTAGLAPVGVHPDDVYRRLYQRVVKQNEEYYRKFPNDVENVYRIVEHLRYKSPYPPVKLEGFEINRGKALHTLTAQSFMTLGRAFGKSSEMKKVHELVMRMKEDIGEDGKGCLGDESLSKYAKLQSGGFRLDQRPLYGVLHEAIYCHSPGVKSDWAAHGGWRQFKSEPSWERFRSQFSWLDNQGGGSVTNPGGSKKLYFSGEMIYPFMFKTSGPVVEGFWEAAEILAAKDNWPALYDEVRLAENTVPVTALAYPDDMYVDFELSKQTAEKVKGHVFLQGKKEWNHGSIKDQAETRNVLNFLFGLDGAKP